MAINLATKYSDKIATQYTIGSKVADKCSTEWGFDGIKSIKIYTPITQALGDYTRSGTSRYGTPTDMDDTVQTLTMTQDKAFSIVIDKGNNNEQLMIKNAGKMMKLENDERVVPMIDKYALDKFVGNAGKIAGSNTALTKGNIVETIMEAETYFSDNAIPDGNRYLYVSSKVYNLARQATEFLAVDKLAEKQLVKGVVGEIAGFKVVKLPDKYFAANVNFVAVHKNSVLIPVKLKDAKIHEDPPGISGALLEGRYMYDAFVIGARCDGVYVHAFTGTSGGTICVTPAIAYSSSTGTTITSTTASAVIKYTTDGTDPRYSETAQTYTAAIEGLTSGTVVKAYASKADCFNSDVKEFKIS